MVNVEHSSTSDLNLKINTIRDRFIEDAQWETWRLNAVLAVYMLQRILYLVPGMDLHVLKKKKTYDGECWAQQCLRSQYHQE